MVPRSQPRFIMNMTISGIPNNMMSRSLTAKFIINKFVTDRRIFRSHKMMKMTRVFPTIPIMPMIQKNIDNPTNLWDWLLNCFLWSFQEDLVGHYHGRYSLERQRFPLLNFQLIKFFAHYYPILSNVSLVYFTEPLFNGLIFEPPFKIFLSPNSLTSKMFVTLSSQLAGVTKYATHKKEMHYYCKSTTDIVLSNVTDMQSMFH